MAKRPSKKQASKAGKILVSPKASKMAKSKAGKTLAAKRIVKTPKKTGKVTRRQANTAVKSVISKRRKK